MVLPDFDDSDEKFLQDMMEAVCPENSEELEREHLEKDKFLHWKSDVLQR
jgi:hypothetical protein